jgi:Fe-S cluster assembly protein SufB
MEATMSAELIHDQSIGNIGNDYSQYGFQDKEDYVFKSGRGLTREIVEKISSMKNEPEWMLKYRLRALDIFLKKPMPKWGNCGLLDSIDFENIFYFVRSSERSEKSWDDVPEGIKQTFDRLGIPEAERKFLAGVTAQYESEVVYHSIREDLEAQGVVFLDMDSGLREHEEIVRKHFGTVIPAADNKFSALNSAVWSGGSFVWVPEGVKVEIPLQAYFRINAENMGQFERTLIIAEPGSFVHYIEGCTAPTYSTDSLHSAVVELIAKPGAHIRYTTIQNWSKNVYNLVTKRAVAHTDAKVEWVDGNIGSKLTMKYPAIHLVGERAHGEVLSIAFAGDDQHQDAGAKMVHAAPNTTSMVVSKSISKNGGRTSYRGLVKVYPNAKGAKSNIKCDALLLDEKSRSDTYPTMEIDEKDVTIEHEATVSKVGEEQLFYLMSRGLTQDEATAMIINGFFEPFTKELPLEYAVELNRLIQLEMSGSVG